MESDSLAFRTARQHVRSYSEESELMQRHAAAMECRDCESFLQMGIDAFEWIMRADRSYRMDMYRGVVPHSPEHEAVLSKLCEQWLGASALADQWIETQLTRGFKLDNLDEFRHCAQEMSAIVEANRGLDNKSLPAPVAELRDAAIQEHRNGETAEFV